MTEDRGAGRHSPEARTRRLTLRHPRRMDSHKDLRMKKSTLMTLGIATVGLVTVAVTGSMQRRGVTDEEEIEPSPCVADATIQLGANPAQVPLGQSSVLSWSVGLPPRCGGVHIQLNGSPVVATGTRSVSPSSPSVFTIIVSMTR